MDNIEEKSKEVVEVTPQLGLKITVLNDYGDTAMVRLSDGQSILTAKSNISDVEVQPVLEPATETLKPLPLTVEISVKDLPEVQDAIDAIKKEHEEQLDGKTLVDTQEWEALRAELTALKAAAPKDAKAKDAKQETK